MMLAPTTAPVRPVMRYHGGKWRLAPWIISHFPAHKVYVEPYGGAGSVLMRKPRAYAEVYNDRWDLIVDVFRVLRDVEQAAELERRIRMTPFARSEIEAIDSAAVLAETDPIERARMLIFRANAGFGSNAMNPDASTGFRATCRRAHTTPAHDWANYPNLIKSFTDRLRGVVIENRAAAQVMEAHDAPDTLHFVDPPYVHETRGRTEHKYAFEMSDDDHRALGATLKGLQGFVALCGYGCALYDEELFADWHRVTRLTQADGAQERTEVLWLNKAVHAALLAGRAQPELFEVSV